MRVILTSALVGTLIGAGGPPPESGDRADDEKAIRSLIDRAAESWAKGDGQAYGALFDEDADYVTFGGMRLKGRGPIAQAHQRLFDGPLAGSRLEIQTDSVKFLGPDVALAHVTGGIVEAGQDRLTAGRNSIQTLVLNRRDGTWKVVACQVTRIIPNAGGPPGGPPVRR